MHVLCVCVCPLQSKPYSCSFNFFNSNIDFHASMPIEKSWTNNNDENTHNLLFDSSSSFILCHITFYKQTTSGCSWQSKQLHKQFFSLKSDIFVCSFEYCDSCGNVHCQQWFIQYFFYSTKFLVATISPWWVSYSQEPTKHNVRMRRDFQTYCQKAIGII